MKNDKKINILPEEIIFPHKIEDIKNIRKDLFDEEFNLKKKEFDNIMKSEKPDAINFYDEYRNEKIMNMEQLLTDKINERNNKIPQISNISEINNILENINSTMEEVVELPINNNQQIDKNLKKKVNFNLKEEDDKIPEIKTTIYEEQKSVELPKNENEKNKKNENIKNNPIVTNFLPINEFIKKINEIDILNKKIDNLTYLVEELVKQQTQQQTQQHQQHQQPEIICENGSYI